MSLCLGVFGFVLKLKLWCYFSICSQIYHCGGGGGGSSRLGKNPNINLKLLLRASQYAPCCIPCLSTLLQYWIGIGEPFCKQLLGFVLLVEWSSTIISRGWWLCSKICIALAVLSILVASWLFLFNSHSYSGVKSRREKTTPPGREKEGGSLLYIFLWTASSFLVFVLCFSLFFIVLLVIRILNGLVWPESASFGAKFVLNVPETLNTMIIVNGAGRQYHKINGIKI